MESTIAKRGQKIIPSKTLDIVIIIIKASPTNLRKVQRKFIGNSNGSDCFRNSLKRSQVYKVYQVLLD